jgi:hypothetical protein
LTKSNYEEPNNSFVPVIPAVRDDDDDYNDDCDGDPNTSVCEEDRRVLLSFLFDDTRLTFVSSMVRVPTLPNTGPRVCCK